MSVAEKLTAIADAIRNHLPISNPLTLDDMAEKVPDVYSAGIVDGYEDGESDGWSLGYDAGYDYGFDEGYTEGETFGTETGIEQGKKDAYDEFWDDFQQNGTRSVYISCFGSGWTTNTFKPKYQIKPVRAMNMFHNNYAEYLKIEDFVEFADNLAKEQGKTIEKNPELFDENGHYNLLDFSECTSTGYSLARLHSKHFGTLDFSKATGLVHLFYTHNYADVCSVEKIDKFKSSPITQYDTTTFQGATFLTDITMSGVVAKSINFGTCPLNKASIISVVNVLSPSTTGQIVTFKKTAVNTAFGINVDDVSTYPVGSEFYNLRNSKSNWTFSYA